MARIITCIVFITAFATLASAKDPIKFESKDGNYLALFPGKPKQSSLTIATDAGNLKVVTDSVSDSSKLLLSISYVDYPPRFSLTDKPAFLTAVAEGLKTKGATLITQPNPDGSMLVALKHSKYDSRTRLMLVGTRLYQVTATGTPDQVDTKPAQQFLASFQPGK